VDLNKGIVRLEVGETKNTEGRTVYLDAELRQIFEQQYEARKRQRKLTPFVFPNKEGYDKINEFRGAWNKACRDAGLIQAQQEVRSKMAR
jgi:integrase